MRSKTPDLVRQEFYGLLVAHFAVRALMHEVALKTHVDPDRVSFIHAVRVVRRKLPAFNAISPVQRKVLHERVLDEILQERVACRRGRRNLRGVKRKMSRLAAATTSLSHQTAPAREHQSGDSDH